MSQSERRLLITDLDNTLYDWVTFFSRAFEAMAREISKVLDLDFAVLLQEFKEVHRAAGGSEIPFAALDLPSVRRRFPRATRGELSRLLDPAFHAFNSVRAKELRLYPGVAETLLSLTAAGVTVVGHTEAIEANAYYRLSRLGIASLFTRLYVLEGAPQAHPTPSRVEALAPPPGLVRSVPRAERKPNPRLLMDICKREGTASTESVYVGDSLARDISMAKAAGVFAVWARYGNDYDPALWAILVSISHWTDDDVQREELLRQRSHRVTPDMVIESYAELLGVFGRSKERRP